MTPSSWNSGSLMLTVVMFFACSSSDEDKSKQSNVDASTMSSTEGSTGGVTSRGGGTSTMSTTGGSAGMSSAAAGAAGNTTSAGGQAGAGQIGTGGTTADAASGSGGQTIDCSNAGCGPPVVCGGACSAAPCGCCPCGGDDYELVDGKAFQCSGGCFAPATYAVLGLATNVLRYSITKVSTSRGTCHRIDLANFAAASDLDVTTPQNWVVEHAWWSSRPSDCDGVYPGPPAGAAVATKATGSISFDARCNLTIDARLSFSTDGGPTTTEAFVAAGLPIPGVCSN